MAAAAEALDLDLGSRLRTEIATLRRAIDSAQPTAR
jgi:hypothetical protein